MEKIIVFDLDGTLLNSNSEIDEQTQKAIRDLDRNKYLPIIATGRGPKDYQDIADMLNIDVVIGMNGHIVTDKHKIIYSSPMNPAHFEDFLQISEQLQAPLVFFGENTSKATFSNEKLSNYSKILNISLPKIDPYFYKNEKIYMTVFATDQDIPREYYTKFINVEFVRTSPVCIDIVTDGISKKTGILEFIKNISNKTEIICFGDSLNDLEMFEFCDYSIAMGNAKKELKEIADFVTLDNDNLGIINGLTKLNLIK
ncbi:hypothetical protein DOK78_001205 [Enterococcus sp. DIV2402]|uniref:Cof-type HAD-IIB family hydrolase n=1 Tax=Candidatus Enterococcus lowellii TaxID=2230877 RepID=A0ABZ2SM48_9ENTE|nr:Cof-type HAD-IIB family hydrolase [Enterococcus sp. DIV2402]MBO0464596.1 Cof-type HAD-IIB family hydrolase [Enterococcus sp. DIV2402]